MKTFKEPTTDENGGVHYEFNTTLKTNAEASDKAILLTPKGTLTIGEEYSSPSISFYKNNEVEDVVTIKYTKFIYKGEEVKDLQTIYDIIKSLTSIELPSDEEIEEKANKIPIGKWETGVDEEGGYYIEPNTNEKWRWGGSMVGKGQSYILYNVEYIEKEAEKRFPYEKHMGDTWGNGLHEGFIIGAEWMKEQILKQNK